MVYDVIVIPSQHVDGMIYLNIVCITGKLERRKVVDRIDNQRGIRRNHRKRCLATTYAIVTQPFSLRLACSKKGPVG